MKERAITPRFLRPWTLPVYRMLRRARTAVQSVTCRVQGRPIFVLGNQKSGTTAIAALLGKLSGEPTTLDLKREMDDPVLPRVHAGEMTFSRFVRRNRLDFSRRIIKEPALTPFCDRLVDEFPAARFVFVLRDPRDNIRSILNRLDLSGDGRVLRDADLRNVNAAWRLVLDSRWLGVPGEHYIEQLAGRWRLMAQAFQEHADRMILIRYEDFAVDKAGAIEGLAGRLELRAVAAISHAVDVAYQPAGDRNVSWSDFFGDTNLELIERICSAEMAEHGYPVTMPGR